LCATGRQSLSRRRHQRAHDVGAATCARLQSRWSVQYSYFQFGAPKKFPRLGDSTVRQAFMQRCRLPSLLSAKHACLTLVGRRNNAIVCQPTREKKQKARTSEQLAPHPKSSGWAAVTQLLKPTAPAPMAVFLEPTSPVASKCLPHLSCVSDAGKPLAAHCTAAAHNQASEASLSRTESPDFMTRGNLEGRFALEHNGKKICNMQTPSLHFFRMSAAMVRFAVCDSNIRNMA
jgi:hypothetical protein